jgi:hypothetical protein
MFQKLDVFQSSGVRIETVPFTWAHLKESVSFIGQLFCSRDGQCQKIILMFILTHHCQKIFDCDSITNIYIRPTGKN